MSNPESSGESMGDILVLEKDAEDDLRIELEPWSGDPMWRRLDEERSYRVVFEGRELAVAQAHCFTIVQGYSSGSGDHDNCAALRAVRIVDPACWATLPWGRRREGELFYGWDHYSFGFSRDVPGAEFPAVSWEEVETMALSGRCRIEVLDGEVQN
jgi:hypothetical protein